MEPLRDWLDTYPTSITLADPTQPDCPLIFANRIFCELTGYEADAVVGHNCRFLQTEGTHPTARARLRYAVTARRGMAACVLNRTREGREFHNLVCIAPVQLGRGRPAIMGCQYELDEALSAVALERHVETVNRALAGPQSLRPAQRMRLTALQMRADNTLTLVSSYVRALRSADRLHGAPLFQETRRNQAAPNDTEPPGPSGTGGP